MVAMFDSGDPTHAAIVVADYVDHQDFAPVAEDTICDRSPGDRGSMPATLVATRTLATPAGLWWCGWSGS